MIENSKLILETPKEYEIDFNKVKSFDDIINILKIFNIKVYDNYERFEEFTLYLKETE